MVLSFLRTGWYTNPGSTQALGINYRANLNAPGSNGDGGTHSCLAKLEGQDIAGWGQHY
jgi:hypothetical protein